METLYGGIETGGTKCICAVGTCAEDLKHLTRIETTSFEETITKIVDYFLEMKTVYHIPSIGIASFGPIDLRKNSSTYGFVTSTPKLEWQNVNLLGTLSDKLNIPTCFDLDVNGAALAEGTWGSAQGLDTYIYITVGTGIGVGIVANRMPVHGLTNPEGGHILIPLHPEDPSAGFCPFHRSCLEGLANAPAIRKRWNTEPETLPNTHFAWELEAYYLAHAIYNYILCISPERVIIGGGVLKRAGLIENIRTKVLALLANYVVSDAVQKNIDTYIVNPSLEYCGVLGGILLASKHRE